MSDTLPPYSTEAEEGALSCCLQDPAKLRELFEAGAHKRWFYLYQTQTIFGILSKLASTGRSADILTLRSALKDAGLLDRIGGEAYLGTLANAAPSPENLAYYIPDLEDKFRRRGLIEFASRIQSSALDLTANSSALLDDADSAWRGLYSSYDESLPRIEDAADMVATEPATPPEIVFGLLHGGSKLVIGGCSKSFKTWTLLDLALSVAYGEPWLSCKTTLGRVLYLNLEIQPWAFRTRISAVASVKHIALEAGRLDCWNLRGRCCDYSDLLPRIRERIHEVGYSLIVLDPVYKLLGKADENKATDITAMMNAIEDLAVSTGAAVAFGAHFSKGNQSSKESIDRISGSGVFARDPDSILVMTKHEEPNAFTVEATLRNFKPIEPFVVRWQFPLMRRDDSLDPAKLKQVKLGRKQRYYAEMLLKFLPAKRATKTVWQKALFEKTGMSRAKFFELFHEIESRVVENKKGYWNLRSPESPESNSRPVQSSIRSNTGRLD